MTRSLLALVVVAGAASTAAAQVVIMDQIGPNSSFQEAQAGRASQDFEPVNDAFDVAMIDDFAVTTNGRITKVEAALVGFGGFTSYGNVQHWRVEVYSSPGAAATNLVGDVASAVIGLGSATLTTPWTTSPISALVSLDTTAANINLGAGTYWLAVIPRLNFGGGGGQLGIMDSTFAGTPSNDNSLQANPGGGFALPNNLAPRNTDCAYRITAVPAPASLGLLGFAGLAAARRRR